MTRDGTQVFVYPEELVDAEPHAVVRRIAELGCNAASMALVYHRARRVFPRQRRISLSPGGAVTFTPHASRYGRLVPTPTAPVELRDAVVRFRAACADAGVAFRAWLVALHNEPLATTHPDTAARTLDGETTGFSLCPSSPDAVTYVAALCDDVCAQLSPDGIDLEAALYPAWEPSYTLTLALEPLDDHAQTYGAQCFCTPCRTLLGEALRARTLQAAGPPFAETRARDVALPAELAALRAGGVQRLIEAVAAAVAGRCELCVTASGLPRHASLRGLAPESVAAADRVLLGMARLTGDELSERLDEMRVLAGDKPLTVSLNWFEGRRYADDARLVAAAGASRLALYNLTLAPEHALPALAAAAAAFAE